MNARFMILNLSRDTTATATPIAQIPREVLRASVELDSVEMESHAEVLNRIQFDEYVRLNLK